MGKLVIEIGNKRYKIPKDDLFLSTLLQQYVEIEDIQQDSHAEMNWKGKKRKNGTPSTKEIEGFILSQPNYRHSLKSVSMAFLGHEPSIHKSRSEYNTMWNKTNRARDNILIKVAGEWKKEKKRFGRHAEFYFVPNYPVTEIKL